MTAEPVPEPSGAKVSSAGPPALSYNVELEQDLRRREMPKFQEEPA